MDVTSFPVCSPTDLNISDTLVDINNTVNYITGFTSPSPPHLPCTVFHVDG